MGVECPLEGQLSICSFLRCGVTRCVSASYQGQVGNRRPCIGQLPFRVEGQRFVDCVVRANCVVRPSAVSLGVPAEEVVVGPRRHRCGQLQGIAVPLRLVLRRASSAVRIVGDGVAGLSRDGHRGLGGGRRTRVDARAVHPAHDGEGLLRRSPRHVDVVGPDRRLAAVLAD